MSGSFLKNPFTLSLLVGSLAILATFLKCAHLELDFFFTSDSLYLPSIYQDIFHEGGHLSEWSLNPAPNFFPDMGVYFVLNGLIGDFRWAHYTFPIVQFLLTAALFRAVVRRACPEIKDASIALGVLLLVMVILTSWWAGDFGFAFHLLVNSFHGGAFVNALLCTWLLLRAHDRTSAGPLALLALAIVASAISDKLFWVMFAVPAALVCLVLALRSNAWGRLVLLAVVVVASTATAHKLFLFMDEALPMRFENPYAYLAFDRVLFSWGRFLYTLHTYLHAAPLVAGTIALCLLATIWSAVVSTRRLIRWWRTPRTGHTHASDRATMVLWMATLFFPFVLLAPVVNGSFDGLDSLRYNFAAFALAPLITGLVIGHWAQRAGRWLVAAGLVGIGAPALWVCALSGLEDYRRIGSYEPEVVTDFDRLTGAWELRNGVANYWVAKRITLFSKQPVTVLPVYPEVGMYVHVNRPAMFMERTFDFVIVHPELPREDLVRIFQQDTGFHTLGKVEVMLTRAWSFDPELKKPRVSPN